MQVAFFAGWLRRDSVEYAPGETGGFNAVCLRLLEPSGYATVRIDKPGAGERQGAPCGKADLEGALEGYRSAFDSMCKYDFLDLDRLSETG